MKYLSARQLAFLMGRDMTVDDARRIIAAAAAKFGGAPIETKGRNKKGRLVYEEDKYPKTLSIDSLSKYLNIPQLQFMVDDFQNYMKRHQTRGYILGYPEEKIRKEITDAGDIHNVKSRVRLKIPSILAEFLTKEDREEIIAKWKEKYSKYSFVDFT